MSQYNTAYRCLMCHRKYFSHINALECCREAMEKADAENLAASRKENQRLAAKQSEQLAEVLRNPETVCITPEWRKNLGNDTEKASR